MGWRAVHGAGRSAAGGGVQALSVGVDGAGRVWEVPGRGGDDLAGAAVEDAVVKQGNPARVVGIVSGPSLSAGGELRTAGPRRGLREKAFARARGRECHAASGEAGG